MGWWSDFKSKVKEKATQLGNAVVSTWQEVKQTTREVWHEIKETTRDVVEYVSDRVQHWTDRAKDAYHRAEQKIKQVYHDTKEKVKEKIKEYKVRTKHPKYVPTKPDQEIATEAKNYIDRKFPRGISQTLMEMPPQERVKAFEEIVTDAAGILDVKIDGINAFTPGEDQINTCGYYRWDDNTLHLNRWMIASDNPRLVEEQVYTVFHELMHARQYAAVTGKKNYEYPKETLLEWAYNFKNYVGPQEDPERYRKQPLERDAFGFESIIKGEFSIEDFIKYNGKK